MTWAMTRAVTRVVTRARDEAAILLLAVQLLTRWPLSASIPHSEERFAAAARYYPLVGALIGAFAGAAFWLAQLAFPTTLAVVVSTAATLLATGAIHEDGFADTCDGLGAGTTRARALEVMRDSRLGTYGVAGLGMMLAIKVLALSELPVESIPWVLIAGHAASRSSTVLAMATSTYVRDTGLARPLSGAIGPAGVVLALATGGAAACVPLMVVPPVAVLVGVAVLAVGHLAMRSAYERRLGGYSGDCLGAVQQTSELGMYLGVLAAT